MTCRTLELDAEGELYVGMIRLLMPSATIPTPATKERGEVESPSLVGKKYCATGMIPQVSA